MTKTFDPFTLPKEMELMLSLALRKPCSVPDGFDENYFKALVEKNRIEPLVGEGSKRLSENSFSVFNSLKAQQNRFTVYAMRQMQVLASIMTGFSEIGIRAISLKGPLLGASLYGNPALRFSRDIDILVSEKDFPEASAYLVALGYNEEINIYNKTPKRRKKFANRDEEMHTEYNKDGVCIELHWRLSFRFYESFDALWEKRDSRRLLGQDIAVLGETDELIYLTCHAAGHVFFRQRWLLDLYELLRKTEISFDTLYNAHKERGIGTVFLETLLILYRYKAFEMPDTKNELFSIYRKNGKVIFSCGTSLDNDLNSAIKLVDILTPLLIKETEDIGIWGRKYMHLLPGLSPKKSIIKAILDVFKPGKADLELIDLADPLFFIYYIIRPFRKLTEMIKLNIKK